MSTVAGTVLALLVLAPSVASAQDAAIEGRVTDTTSLILPGVTVAARHVTSGQVRTVFADGAGTFTITALQPGTYDVTFTLPGFATVVREGVAISVGATVTLDVEMPVQLQEQVVVVGSRAQPRSVTESTVPIDAIPFQDIVRQGAATARRSLPGSTACRTVRRGRTSPPSRRSPCDRWKCCATAHPHSTARTPSPAC